MRFAVLMMARYSAQEGSGVKANGNRSGNVRYIGTVVRMLVKRCQQITRVATDTNDAYEGGRGNGGVVGRRYPSNFQ